MPSKARPQTLADRVRLLVDSVHEGNVNAAAKDLGIAQATLARIVAADPERRVENPRRDALEKIAKFYNVSADWLLSGEGRGPAPQSPYNVLPQAEVYRWIQFVDRLGVTGPGREALASLPYGVVNAIHNLPFREDGKTESGLRIRAAYRDAIALELRAWLKYFAAAIDGWGTERVREHLSKPDVIAELRGRFPTHARAGEAIGGPLEDKPAKKKR